MGGHPKESTQDEQKGTTIKQLKLGYFPIVDQGFIGWWQIRFPGPPDAVCDDHLYRCYIRPAYACSMVWKIFKLVAYIYRVSVFEK